MVEKSHGGGELRLLAADCKARGGHQPGFLRLFVVGVISVWAFVSSLLQYECVCVILARTCGSL